MELSDKKGVRKIVLTLAKLGLRHVIISPGSRNAPFVISFLRHGGFHCHSVRDERSAAFFALGKAIESRQPVAILCTSGSATLNFAPAISEAFYRRIPLIVLTTDRPAEWTDQGDGQTIRQSHIYRNYVRQSYDLKGDADSNDPLWHIERCLSEGWNIATRANPGPVHFNIPLKEPLYVTAEADDAKPRVFHELNLDRHLSAGDLKAMAEIFNNTRKVMVLVGQHQPERELSDGLTDLATHENVIVLTESTSNVHHPHFVENIDRLITGLNDDDTADLMPDLLITMGGAVVSKRIKGLLRKHRPYHHWNIHPHDSLMDTYQSLTHAIPLPGADFLKQFNGAVSGMASDYRQRWLALKERKKRLHDDFAAGSEYCDFSIFNRIIRTIPDDWTVHIANSSPIRYVQLFDNSHIADMQCNRGTSGIEGCTGTAMGAASASPGKKFLLITGDIAFHYDVNALWNEARIENLNIIVINNAGGGIFRIIEGPDKALERPEFIETVMHTDAKHIAAHHDWNYLEAHDATSLDRAIQQLFDGNTGRTILEIFTDADKNPLVLGQYWNYLKEKN